jgi:mRNA interferase RelE/StbE
MPAWKRDSSLSEKSYRIFETNEFIKRPSKLNRLDAKFIQNKLCEYTYPQLRSEPHFWINIKKLFGYKPETYRYRIGKFRVFFSIDEQEKIINIVLSHLEGWFRKQGPFQRGYWIPGVKGLAWYDRVLPSSRQGAVRAVHCLHWAASKWVHRSGTCGTRFNFQSIARSGHPPSTP